MAVFSPAVQLHRPHSADLLRRFQAGQRLLHGALLLALMLVVPTRADGQDMAVQICLRDGPERVSVVMAKKAVFGSDYIVEGWSSGWSRGWTGRCLHLPKLLKQGEPAWIGLAARDASGVLRAVTFQPSRSNHSQPSDLTLCVEADAFRHRQAANETCSGGRGYGALHFPLRLQKGYVQDLSPFGTLNYTYTIRGARLGARVFGGTVAKAPDPEPAARSRSTLPGGSSRRCMETARVAMVNERDDILAPGNRVTYTADRYLREDGGWKHVRRTTRRFDLGDIDSLRTVRWTECVELRLYCAREGCVHSEEIGYFNNRPIRTQHRYRYVGLHFVTREAADEARERIERLIGGS
jgi:hypothetical protein